jgi:hypothetical protein
MYSSNLRLHFTTDDAYSGLAKVEGILRAEKNRLILEYQVKDNLIGVIKSSPKELRIPFEELSEVTYKLNWFVSRFRLHINSMKILGEFPVGKDGVISLRIRRKQKEMAKDLISYINLRLSEIRLDRLDRLEVDMED